MKIAVRFHDNDFLKTFLGVMKTLLTFYQFEKKFSFTKEQFLDIINHLSFAHYRLYQNKFEDIGYDDSHIEEYLQLKIHDILIDDEVDTYLRICKGWDNDETVVLDTDLDFPNNNPIYLV